MKKASIIVLQLFCIVVYFSISANAQIPCEVTVNPNSFKPSGNGNNGSFYVTTEPTCNWTAVSSIFWIKITSGASGTGNGVVNFTVEPNTGSTRFGTISVNGKQVFFEQGRGCVWTVSPTTLNVPASPPPGATEIIVSVNVTLSQLCSAGANTNDSWITPLNTIQFSGTLNFRIQNNTGAAQTGKILAFASRPGPTQSQEIIVNQAAGQINCTYSLNPTSLIVPQGGGNYSVNIITQDGCAWTAENQSLGFPRPVSLTSTSPTTGMGSGKVDFTISPAFTQSTRQGRIYVNGATLEIRQDNFCQESTATSHTINVPREGITQTVFYALSNSAGCNITIRFNDSWITSAGTINGGHGYSVAPNNGAARTGTISTILTSTLGTYQDIKTITINQAGQTNCTYSINPTSTQAGAAGGDTGFELTTEAGCNWTAQSNASWITISNPTGSGAGRINYSVQSNTGQARTGTITVGGQTFPVNQDADAVVQPTLINLRVKVVDANYKDIRNASVSFTNTTTGETRMTQSNPFGWVLFSNVTSGQTYRIEIKHKRYTFITFNTVFDNNSVLTAFVAEP